MCLQELLSTEERRNITSVFRMPVRNHSLVRESAGSQIESHISRTFGSNPNAVRDSNPFILAPDPDGAPPSYISSQQGMRRATPLPRAACMRRPAPLNPPRWFLRGLHKLAETQDQDFDCAQVQKQECGCQIAFAICL